MTRWDDDLYLKYRNDRDRPAGELLRRVVHVAPERVIDLGCGPGNSTALLRARWPDADVLGIDSSPEMIERARRDVPSARFELRAVEDIRAEQVDVLFANALFQWVPGHRAILDRLVDMLAPNGVLAFQVPDNWNEPSHRAMRELEGPWSASIDALPAREQIGSPSEYYDLFTARQMHVDVWRTTYEHVMTDAGAIVEWVRGTGLRPFLDAAGSERDRYLAAYQAAIDRAYPPRADGKRLFSFPRLFVVATRIAP